VDVDVFSVTSWSELARDGQRAFESNAEAFIAQQLQASQGPVIAATDYVRAVPESVRAFIPADRSYTTLGTDGFGRSDTRAALRDFFGVDAASVVRAALKALR
jgi:pyruvate dehydrogenase E1 component